MHASALPPILLGRGTSDPWYTADKSAADQSILRAAGVSVAEHVFKAGHVWDPSFISAAEDFLERIRNRNLEPRLTPKPSNQPELHDNFHPRSSVFRPILIKTPILTLAAILSLGLGIGANTTVFSWVQSVLLRPIPGAADPDAIFILNVATREGRARSWSYPNYRDVRDRATLVEVIGQDDLAMSIAVKVRPSAHMGRWPPATTFRCWAFSPRSAG